MSVPPSAGRALRPDPPPRRRRRHLSGLPGERTLLAWDRTALSLLGNGALLILRDAGTSHPLRLGAAVLTGLLAAMCGLLASLRARSVAHHRGGAGLPPATFAICGLSLGVVSVCALELMAIVRA